MRATPAAHLRATGARLLPAIGTNAAWELKNSCPLPPAQQQACVSTLSANSTPGLLPLCMPGPHSTLLGTGQKLCVNPARKSSPSVCADIPHACACSLQATPAAPTNARLSTTEQIQKVFSRECKRAQHAAQLCGRMTIICEAKPFKIGGPEGADHMLRNTQPRGALTKVVQQVCRSTTGQWWAARQFHKPSRPMQLRVNSYSQE